MWVTALKNWELALDRISQLAECKNELWLFEQANKKQFLRPLSKQAFYVFKVKL